MFKDFFWWPLIVLNWGLHFLVFYILENKITLIWTIKKKRVRCLTDPPRHCSQHALLHITTSKKIKDYNCYFKLKKKKKLSILWCPINCNCKNIITRFLWFLSCNFSFLSLNIIARTSHAYIMCLPCNSAKINKVLLYSSGLIFLTSD